MNSLKKSIAAGVFAAVALVTSVGAHASVQKPTDAQVVSAVSQWARSSNTFGDFASNVKDPAARNSLIESLKATDLWDARLPEIFSSGDNFELDLATEPALAFQFVSQPKPHLLFAHRVIDLKGRGLKEVAKEVSAAYAAYLHDSDLRGKGALLRLSVEEAKADPLNNQLMAGAVAGLVSADSFQNPELNDDVASLQTAMKSARQKFKVTCVSADKPSVVQPTVTFTSGLFFNTWIVRNYKSDSNFDLDNVYSEDMPSNNCHFHFKEPDGLSRQPINCGSATIKDAKGSGSRALQSMLPTVPLARLAHCCNSSPDCEKKINGAANGVGTSAPSANDGRTSH